MKDVPGSLPRITFVVTFPLLSEISDAGFTDPLGNMLNVTEVLFKGIPLVSVSLENDRLFEWQ